MPPILNLRFLSQTSFDSAAPSGTGVVVHRFEGDGEFQLRIHRGDEVLRRVPVNVGRGPGGGKGEGGHDRHGPGGDPLAAQPPQADGPAGTVGAITLDMATLLRPGTDGPTVDELPSRGYLSITSSQPFPEHHVVVSAGEGGADVLDTRRLGSNSLFAVTLARPGRYRLVNGITGSQADVVVTYPTVGSTPYRPPAPLEIRCTAEGFGASRFTISPAQGIVFRLATESRIQLELVEPDDGPGKGRPRPKASYRAPQPPPAQRAE